MNGTLSPSLLVSVFGMASHLEREFGREQLYMRNDSSRSHGISPVPNLRKPGIPVMIRVGHARTEQAA